MIDWIRGIFRNREIFRLIKNSGYFFGTSVVGIAISFVSFPVYALLLSKEEFGILAFFSAVGVIVAQFSVLSLTNFYIVRSRDLNVTESRLLFRNIVLFNFFWNIGISVLGAIALYFYLILTNSEMEFFPNGLIIFVIMASQSFISFKNVQFRIEGEGRKFFLTGVAQLVGNAVLGIGAIWFFFPGATGKFLGIAASNVLIAMFLSRGLFGSGDGKLSFRDVREGIREMLPLTMVSFLHSTAPAADVLVLERFNDPAGLGVYNVGKQIGNFITLAGTSIFQAFEPGFYEDAKKTSLYRSGRFQVFVVMLILLAALYFIFSDLIITILTAGKFYDSLEYSNVFVLQVLFLPVIQALQIPLYLAKKVKLIAAINLFGSVVMFVLIFVLTANEGYTGAAVAFVISAFIQLIALLFSRRNNGSH